MKKLLTEIKVLKKFILNFHHFMDKAKISCRCLSNSYSQISISSFHILKKSPRVCVTNITCVGRRKNPESTVTFSSRVTPVARYQNSSMDSKLRGEARYHKIKHLGEGTVGCVDFFGFSL